MYSSPSLKFALFAALLGSAFAQLNETFVASLRNAGTAPQRLALLSDSDVSAAVPSHFLLSNIPLPQLLFDFNNPSSGVVTGSGGRTVEASSLNFPAVISNGVAMSKHLVSPMLLSAEFDHG